MKTPLTKRTPPPRTEDQRLRARRHVHKRVLFVLERLGSVIVTEHDHLTGPEYDTLYEAEQTLHRAIRMLNTDLLALSRKAKQQTPPHTD